MYVYIHAAVFRTAHELTQGNTHNIDVDIDKVVDKDTHTHTHGALHVMPASMPPKTNHRHVSPQLRSCSPTEAAVVLVVVVVK